jgi:hypothetical protein
MDIIDEKKIELVLDKVRKIINKAALTIPELLITYGNLGYNLGASMAGFTDKGPSIEDLKKSYYSNPSVDVGLMLQGLLITSWEKDFSQKPQLSNLIKKGEQK